jgi:acyl carrier protein
MSRTDIASSLIDFIRSDLLGGRGPASLGPDDDLLGSGLVDSLGVMRLIGFIEQELGIKVPPGDVTIEHFMTVGHVCTYLESRQD